MEIRRRRIVEGRTRSVTAIVRRQIARPGAFELPEDVLVSAVMPTRGRREMAAKALASFHAQTYPHKELIILDDADNPSFEQAPDGTRYQRLTSRLKIPDKRNAVCRAAAGAVIMHWDSDDWSDPNRMAAQVAFMREKKRPVVGYKSMLFWDLMRKQAWIYEGDPTYALGTSLAFTKAWWEHNPWDRKFEIGSDYVFVKHAESRGALAVEHCGKLMIATTHEDNSCKRNYGIYWKKVRQSEIPQEFFA